MVHPRHPSDSSDIDDASTDMESVDEYGEVKASEDQEKDSDDESEDGTLKGSSQHGHETDDSSDSGEDRGSDMDCDNESVKMESGADDDDSVAESASNQEHESDSELEETRSDDVDSDYESAGLVKASSNLDHESDSNSDVDETRGADVGSDVVSTTIPNNTADIDGAKATSNMWNDYLDSDVEDELVVLERPVADIKLAKAFSKREYQNDSSSVLEVTLRAIKDSKDAPVKEPASKKQKTTANGQKEAKAVVRRVRGRRGALQNLPEMPLDILFEIFENLSPLDLVNLTRTSSSLRKVLLEKSAHGVWKESHSNLEGLPNCPEDMTMQRYICLILEKHCQRCASRTAHVCWEFRLRLCSKCIEADSRFVWNTSTYSGSVVLRCCPAVILNMSYGRKRGTYTFYDDRYLKAHYGKYMEMNDEEKECWEMVEKKRVNTVRQHVLKCDEWLENQAEQRSNALENIRSKRMADIVQRLRDIGWGDLIDDLYGDERIETHWLVNQKKELTERIWKNIKPHLVEYLEEKREEREMYKKKARIDSCIPVLQQFYESYKSSKPVNTIIPPIFEFIQYKPLQDFFCNTDDTISANHIAKFAAENNIDSFCMQWKKEMDRILLRIATGLHGPLTQSDVVNAEANLQKAKVAFHCEFCDKTVEYPRILMHVDINTPSAFAPFTCPKMLENAFEKLVPGYDNYRYKNQRVRIKDNYAAAVTLLLSACGLNPDARIEDVDTLDPFFEYSSNSGKEVLLRSWRAAISHYMSNSADSKPDGEDSFKLVTDEQMLRDVRSRRREAFLRDWKQSYWAPTKLSSIKTGKDYICTSCRFRGSSGFEMKEHLVTKHNKTDAEKGDIALYIDREGDMFEYEFPVDFLGLL